MGRREGNAKSTDEQPQLGKIQPATKRDAVLSFIPQQHKTHYPYIKPGIYIFVQNKHTKQVFLWNTNLGHGHPFLANLVNQEVNQAIDDYSWVGGAGEMVFGKVLIAHSYCTGFFHDSLGLTEPASEKEFNVYCQKIHQRLESSLLPTNCHFYVKEWEEQIFNKRNRDFFFTPDGYLQNHNCDVIDQFRQQLNLTASCRPYYSEKTRLLFERLFTTMEHYAGIDLREIASTAIHYYPTSSYTNTQPGLFHSVREPAEENAYSVIGVKNNKK